MAIANFVEINNIVLDEIDDGRSRYTGQLVHSFKPPVYIKTLGRFGFGHAANGILFMK